MQITIQLAPQIAGQVTRQLATSTPPGELLKTAKELGVALRPMHPGVQDPNLSRYFLVEIPDVKEAETTLSRLRHCQGVEAAYIKPQEELP